MLAFLDESGDAGVSRRPGSSDYFVVALVLFNSDQEAAATDERIVSLRSSLSLPASFEFKFNKLSRPLRLAFLDDVAACNFSYFGAVIDKTAIRPSDTVIPFQKAIEVLFQLAAPSLQASTTLVMDGDGNRYLQRELKAAVRKTVGIPGSIQKLKLQDSRFNNLIQLADMVSGAIYRDYSAKNDAEVYRKAIFHRETEVRRWPG